MRLQHSLFALACLLPLGALSAPAASISVNGICEVGTCNTSDILAPNASTTTPFNFTYTFANSDSYEATGTIGAAYDIPFLEITSANIILTYLGNSTNTTSANDVLTLDMFEYFALGGPSGSNKSGFESIAGNFTGDYADASSVTGRAVSNGVDMQLLGPFSPPSDFSASASNQPFAFSSVTRFGFLDTVTFGAGSGEGASISVNNVPVSTPPPSPVPEPSTLILLGSGILGMAGVARRRFLHS